MKIVTINLTNSNSVKFDSKKSNDEIFEEIFSKELYASKFANKAIIINTNQITYVEIEEEEYDESSNFIR